MNSNFIPLRRKKLITPEVKTIKRSSNKINHRGKYPKLRILKPKLISEKTVKKPDLFSFKVFVFGYNRVKIVKKKNP